MQSQDTFIVKPVNTVKGIKNYFEWVNPWITPEHCPLKPLEGERKIKLIKAPYDGETDEILKFFEKEGVIPTPTNYLIGLAVQYRQQMLNRTFVVSLDKKSLFIGQRGKPCLISFCAHEEIYLDLQREKGDDPWQYIHWNYAVEEK
jgi:hypothetical protein